MQTDNRIRRNKHHNHRNHHNHHNGRNCCTMCSSHDYERAHVLDFLRGRSEDLRAAAAQLAFAVVAAIHHRMGTFEQVFAVAGKEFEVDLVDTGLAEQVVQYEEDRVKSDFEGQEEDTVNKEEDRLFGMPCLSTKLFSQNISVGCGAVLYRLLIRILRLGSIEM